MKRLVTIIAAVVAIAIAAFVAVLLADGTDSTPRQSAAAGSPTIPQPPLDRLNLRTRRRLAPAGRRIDLAVPSFSRPTEITNPLFPISRLRSAILIGKFEGRPWRAETTLLPGTETVNWNHRSITTRRSQFVAYLSGRIYEVAVDRYAQADDGSVWYLGEDAFSYTRGVVANTEGTWLAGKDGPPAMIMPGDPRVGDVYRTENIPGVVFEEVTVKRLGVTLQGPTGPVGGALIARELHMDESRLEDKVFAPGYGEFHSGGPPTFEATALAIPADALAGPVPLELRTLSAAADSVVHAAQSRNWTAAARSLERMNRVWNAFRSDAVPAKLAAQMTQALITVGKAVNVRQTRAASEAALGVVGASLDLQLRYRTTREVNRARFDLRLRQLNIDAAARDLAGIRGDIATLGWIRARLTFAAADGRRVDDQLRRLKALAAAGQLGAVRSAALSFRKLPAVVAGTP